jgi:methyltransferase
VIATIAIVVFGVMLVEARRAARNEQAQRARGGLEPEGDVYAVMRVAYPAAFLAMIVEGLWRGAAPASVALWSGTALWAAAKGLKWWAIRALGPAWTFRVLVVPGSALVTSGPYRFIGHPNYLAVAGELCAVALMTGALLTGPLVTAAFGLLMLRRIAVERRALRVLLGGGSGRSGESCSKRQI